MPEYSRQGTSGPRFVPADEGQGQTGRPRMQSVPRPAGPAQAGGPAGVRGPAVSRGPAAARGSAGPRGAEAFRPRSPRDSAPARRPGPGDPRAGGAGGASTGPRLTGRGAVLGLFILSFVGILASGWMGTGIVADVLFVAGGGGVARVAKTRGPLPGGGSPPPAFFFSCLLAKLILSSGGTSAAEGI